MSTLLSKKSILFIIIALVVAGGSVWYIKNRYETVPVVIPKTTQHTPTQIKPSTPDKQPGLTIPESKLLKVPFTAQAPTANWDELHNEACEEASAIMTAEYFRGNTNAKLQPEFVEAEISKITEWFKNEYGYYLDTTSKETAAMIEHVYGLQTQLIENFTENDIKQAIAENKVVIISFNGRLLNNPNFKHPGPIHHMLVVKGYTANDYITNDPGTRNGMNYAYTWDIIHDAAGDWDHEKNTTDTNNKVAIVVSKE